MKIVFTGITGLLGSYFLKTKSPDSEVIGIADKNIVEDAKNSFKVDITNKKSAMDLIGKINPSVIVHAASIGNVDYCEQHPDEAYAVNVEGTQNIIEAAKKIKAKIIFLSSNAIYDGENPPYDEKSSPKPLDVYGKTKVDGENLIKNSDLDFVILRLITMYGWPSEGGRSNPVTWVIEKLKRGDRIKVVTDIYNNHLWVGQAAEVVWKIIRGDIKNDIYNIAGADCISRYNLVLKVAAVFNLDSSLIAAVSSDFFKEIAPRPKNTCFNTAKMKKELNINPLSIDEGLLFMRQEVNENR